MIIVLMGKTASGKDSVCRELAKRGVTRIITYTTRPIRPGETNGISYHFISKDDFIKKINEGFFAEYKEYHVADGSIWYYGSAAQDYDTDELRTIILTPAGYRDMKDVLSGKSYTIYLYANRATIRKRLAKRGDDKTEADRRLEQDRIDFRGLECEVDRIVYNSGGKTISEIADEILKYVKSKEGMPRNENVIHGF